MIGQFARIEGNASESTSRSEQILVLAHQNDSQLDTTTIITVR